MVIGVGSACILMCRVLDGQRIFVILGFPRVPRRSEPRRSTCGYIPASLPDAKATSLQRFSRTRRQGCDGAETIVNDREDV